MLLFKGDEMEEIKYKAWFHEVGRIIHVVYENAIGWEAWDEWRQYYDDGFSPDEAVREAHRRT